jgi:hypothetical protein
VGPFFFLFYYGNFFFLTFKTFKNLFSVKVKRVELCYNILLKDQLLSPGSRYIERERVRQFTRFERVSDVLRWATCLTSFHAFTHFISYIFLISMSSMYYVSWAFLIFSPSKWSCKFWVLVSKLHYGNKLMKLGGSLGNVSRKLKRLIVKTQYI